METKAMRFDTKKIKAGYDPSQHNGSVAVPIYQTAAFELGGPERAERLFSGEEFGYVYSRMCNPTAEVVERRIASLHCVPAAVATCSGMAAITYTLFTLAEDGGRILTTPELYGGTIDSFNALYPHFRIHFDYVRGHNDLASFREQIRPDTKALFVESISNPNAQIADLEALADIAHAHGIPLVVDNTFATPYLLNPFDYGADIVVYSATKLLNGHGNVIAGIILENGGFPWDNGKFPNFTEKRYTMRDREGRARSVLEAFPDFPFTARTRSLYVRYFGASLSPFDSYLLLIGLETLSERLRKQVETTARIVRYLEESPHVAWVNHPFTKNSAQKELAQKYLPKGGSTIFSFGLDGTPEQIRTFLNAVSVFSYHTNVGDARSLIVNPPATTHAELTPEERERANIPPNSIRLSIGLEDPRDLMDDLERAFHKTFAPHGTQGHLLEEGALL